MIDCRDCKYCKRIEVLYDEWMGHIYEFECDSPLTYEEMDEECKKALGIEEE